MRCLIIGAGGPVGIGLLQFIKQFGWTCVAADPRVPAHLAEHQAKLGPVLERWVMEKWGLPELDAALAREKFDIVIDLAPTFDKRLSIGVCDKYGVSLINSTMVDFKDDIHIAAYNFIDNRPTAANRPHIVAAGMNPGAVNAMAEEIIKLNEVPHKIVFWEYDNSAPHDGVWTNSATTWCQGESHDEITCDWNFEVIEEGSVVLHEDALDWEMQQYADSGVPFDKVAVPPEAEAFLCGHEECIYLGWRHDTAVKFIYGLHPENMNWIRKNSYGGKPDLLVCTPGKPLLGRDVVGVSCRYDDTGEWIGQYCVLDNTIDTPPDTNATCILVAAGIAAAARVVENGVAPVGVHLTHELPTYLDAFKALVPVHSYTIKDPPPVAARTRTPVGVG